MRDLKGQAGEVAQLVEFFSYKSEALSPLIGTHIKKQGGEHVGSQCCWYGDRRTPGAHWSASLAWQGRWHQRNKTWGWPLALSLSKVILLSLLYTEDFRLRLVDFLYPVEFLFLMDHSCDLFPSSVYLEPLAHNFLCKENQLMMLMNKSFIQQFFVCILWPRQSQGDTDLQITKLSHHSFLTVLFYFGHPRFSGPASISRLISPSPFLQ